MYPASPPTPQVHATPPNSPSLNEIATIWKEAMFVIRGLHTASAVEDPMFTA
jgi:hypothetical protein